MSRIAYLSMDSLEDFECYDHLTIEPLAQLGHEVDTLSWRAKVAWSDYDYVIIRSPWDYQDDAPAFLEVLRSIEASSATLLNPLETVLWNINKRYLRDLEAAGTLIVPTQWKDSLQAGDLTAAKASFDCDEIIIKPAVSANADDTFRLNEATITAEEPRLVSLFTDRQCLIQPFLGNVLAEGEYSLFYFAGQLSHCILKTPKSGDFRVQEEHGGRLTLVQEPAPALLSAGTGVLANIGEQLLYARLDFVRSGESYLLMEAELIEPSLYFNLDPHSPQRFAEALDGWVARAG